MEFQPKTLVLGSYINSVPCPILHPKTLWYYFNALKHLIINRFDVWNRVLLGYLLSLLPLLCTLAAILPFFYSANCNSLPLLLIFR